MAEPTGGKQTGAAMAAFVAVIRRMEDRLPLAEDPGQYLRVLELAAPAGSKVAIWLRTDEKLDA